MSKGISGGRGDLRSFGELSDGQRHRCQLQVILGVDRDVSSTGGGGPASDHRCLLLGRLSGD